MSKPVVVYKFRSFKDDFHRRVLTHNELFFASPGSFNDPFDFKISLDYSLHNTDEKRLEYINKMITDSLPILAKRRIDVDRKRKELLWRLTHDLEKMQDEYDQVNFRWSDKRFGVISFSRSWDNILLWSHYSDNHRGFALGLNLEKLRREGFVGAEGPIAYSEELQKVDPINHKLEEELVIRTFTKAKVWEYENEYRIANIWSDFEPLDSDRRVTFLDDCIEEIVLGLNISEEDQKLALSVAIQKGKPVFKVVKMRGCFLIDRIRL